MKRSTSSTPYEQYLMFQVLCECRGSVPFKLNDDAEYGAFLSLFATLLFCVNNHQISLLKWFWHKHRGMLFVSFTVVHRHVLACI